jgi:hypothetical protein
MAQADVKICFRCSPEIADALNALAKGRRGLRELIVAWLGEQQPEFAALAKRELQKPDGRRRRSATPFRNSLKRSDRAGRQGREE